MELKIEYVKKEELQPYVNNAKIHTPEQVEQIKKTKIQTTMQKGNALS